MIWNHKIWGAYSASAGWRKYTGANPHTDHVHISFTWAGARKKTSFWTGKVGNVGSAPTPTLPAGPDPLPGDPATPRPGGGTVATGRTRRRGDAAARPRAGRRDLSVPAASAGALTTGRRVTAGGSYLIEASGTYHWGSTGSRVADAECSRAPGDSTWRRDRSVHPWQPSEDHLDLYVDGTDLQAAPDVDTGGTCDTPHAHLPLDLPAATHRPGDLRPVGPDDADRQLRCPDGPCDRSSCRGTS